MKNPIWFLLAGSLCALPAQGQTPSGREILDRIDKNMASETRIVQSSMIVHGRRGSRTIESKTWAQGTDRSFTEYLSPARERGTKMLKLEDQLWMYSPSTDRTIQISGHMLRQSVMGSDLSYEDMMENPELADDYEARVSGSETIDGRDCWVVDMTGVVGDLAYPLRKVWVDKSRWVPLKEELFARSGKLLKKIELSDIRQIEGRWFPMRMRFKDVLKTGEGTEFIVDSIAFDVEIPEVTFTKAMLRR
ncbi:MAG TPA: outer membrane lipoprotein-sorting protein [bacterium]|nr:outer membrane lipoprotein-sorting protein [bacterium]